MLFKVWLFECNYSIIMNPWCYRLQCPHIWVRKKSCEWWCREEREKLKTYANSGSTPRSNGLNNVCSSGVLDVVVFCTKSFSSSFCDGFFTSFPVIFSLTNSTPFLIALTAPTAALAVLFVIPYFVSNFLAPWKPASNVFPVTLATLWTPRPPFLATAPILSVLCAAYPAVPAPRSASVIGADFVVFYWKDVGRREWERETIPCTTATPTRSPTPAPLAAVSKTELKEGPLSFTKDAIAASSPPNRFRIKLPHSRHILTPRVDDLRSNVIIRVCDYERECEHTYVGAQSSQKICPQRRQWCFLLKNVNDVLQSPQLDQSASLHHFGSFSVMKCIVLSLIFQSEMYVFKISLNLVWRVKKKRFRLSVLSVWFLKLSNNIEMSSSSKTPKIKERSSKENIKMM